VYDPTVEPLPVGKTSTFRRWIALPARERARRPGRFRVHAAEERNSLRSDQRLALDFTRMDFSTVKDHKLLQISQVLETCEVLFGLSWLQRCHDNLIEWLEERFKRFFEAA